ncbi:AAA family ATPase [Demequina sp.]|uniref:AAA family ATPase n=1 Tax=Demequina sp. TaxID=2050685 RepID=UPI003D11CA78
MADLSSDSEVLVLVGRISAGKTTLANALTMEPVLARRISARECLLAGVPESEVSRGDLQRLGVEVDTRTEGMWLFDHASSLMDGPGRYVIDAARTERQARPFLEQFASSRLLFVDAPEALRRARYEQSAGQGGLRHTPDTHAVFSHPIERGVVALAEFADAVVNTGVLGPEETAAVARELMGWG